MLLAKKLMFSSQNNVAVAAAYLKTMYRTRERPIKRVLILDWSVAAMCGLLDADIRIAGTCIMVSAGSRMSMRQPLTRHTSGNGTQRAFWTDPDVLYISLHVYQNGEFYPGGPYGSASTTGSAPGEGRYVPITDSKVLR